MNPIVCVLLICFLLIDHESEAFIRNSRFIIKSNALLHHNSIKIGLKKEAVDVNIDENIEKKKIENPYEASDKSDLNPNLFFGISPEVFAILTVYFVQGALGLSRLAVTFFLKDDLHLSPTETGVITGLTTLPWVIKPLYGFLSDGFPLFGYRRRSYLVLAGLIGCFSWICLGSIINDTSWAVVGIIAGSASIAVSDVVADSIVVEKSRDMTRESGVLLAEEGKTSTSAAGDLQSLCWGSAAVGGILSAYFSGSLLQTVPPKTVFLLTSVFPLMISAVSLLIVEKKIEKEESASFGIVINNIKNQFGQLFTTFKNPAIYLPVLFIFLWQATPSPDSAMFYFTTNELKFQPEFLGQIRLAANIAALGGVLAYRNWLKDISVKSVIFWCTLVSVPLGLTQLLLTSHLNRELGIPDQLFALTDTVVLSVLGQIAFMPTLALAASLCPPGVEGTLFASLMSINNAAGTVGSELGAGLTSALKITENNFDNLSLLVGFCNLSSLIPLLFINQLLGSQETSEEIDLKN